MLSRNRSTKLQIVIRDGRVIIYAERLRTCELCRRLVENMEKMGVKTVNTFEQIYCG